METGMTMFDNDFKNSVSSVTKRDMLSIHNNVLQIERIEVAQPSDNEEKDIKVEEKPQ